MKKFLIIAMPFDHGLSGISVYIKELVARLSAEFGKDVVIDLIIQKNDLGYFPNSAKNLNYKVYPSWLGTPIKNMLFHLFYLPLKLQFIKWFFKKENHYDVVLLPAGNRRMCVFYPFYTLAVVHDFSPLRLLGKYDKFRTFYAKYIVPFFLKRVDRVLAVSRSTLGDVIHLTKVPEIKVGLCYPGCKIDHFPAINYAGKKSRSEIKKQWGIRKKYLLFVSRIEHPGKNHIGLMKAYSLLSQKDREKYDLVFAGSDWKDSEKVRSFACNSLDCHNIHFLGFVTNDELSLLYSGASLFVFPSFYEGFGFPVLEAMAHKVPVVVSNRSSLLELGFSSTVSFDPNSEEEMANAIKSVLKSEKKQKFLVKKGLERVSAFSWEASIKRMRKFLELKDEEEGFFDSMPTPKIQKDVKKIIEEENLFLERREIFGVSFINASLYKALALFKEVFRLKAKANVFFMNANSINFLQKDIEYKKALLHADYVFPDGVGIRLACMVSGFSMKHNLNGTDFFPHLIQLCELEKKSIFFLGGKQGVTKEVAKNLIEQHPKLKIAGTHHGYFKENESISLIKKINATRAKVLLVGIGTPLQEKWIFKHSSMLDAKVILGVGGLFDYYSGRVKRAPHWISMLGMEWSFRLRQEPKRLWKRYLLGNFSFLMKLPLLYFTRKELPSFFEDKGND